MRTLPGGHGSRNSERHGVAAAASTALDACTDLWSVIMSQPIRPRLALRPHRAIRRLGGWSTAASLALSLSACIPPPPEFPGEQPLDPADAGPDGQLVNPMDNHPPAEPADGQCPVLIHNGCTDVLGPPGATVIARAEQLLAAPGDYHLVSVLPPTGGFSGTAREQIADTTRVVVDEINRQGAFRALDGRSFAVLVCSDGAADPQAGAAAAHHAIDCGARLLVGGDESTAAINLYQSVARDRGVPLISPGAITPTIADIRTLVGNAPNDHLLWRVKVPADVTARAVGQLIDAVDRHRSIKLLYRRDDPYGVATSRIIGRILCAGEDDCVDGRAPDDRAVEATAYDAPPGAELTAEIVERVADPRIDLIVHLNSSIEDSLDLFNGMAEAGAEAEVIALEGVRSSLALDLFLLQGDSAERLSVICRTLGISGGQRGAGWPAWQSLIELNSDLRADELYPPTPHFADALIIGAFALAAATIHEDEHAAHWLRVRDGLRRVSDPEGPVIGPDQWAEGIDQLAQAGGAGTINYQGITGTIDLDPETNDVTDRQTEGWYYVLGQGREDRQIGALPAPLTNHEGRLNLDVLGALTRAPESLCGPYPFGPLRGDIE